MFRSGVVPLLVWLSSAALGCGDTQPTPSRDAVATNAAATATATATASAAATVATTATEAPPEASAAPTASSDAKPPPTGTGATAAPTGTASAQASASPDVDGEQKKGAAFSAYLSAKGSYKKGQPAAVTAVINAVGDYKINKEYPFKFKMGAAPAGVSYPEAIVRAVSRAEKRATMSIPFTPDAAGTATISGECSLSVCTDSNCVIEKAQLSVSVKIED